MLNPETADTVIHAPQSSNMPRRSMSGLAVPGGTPSLMRYKKSNKRGKENHPYILTFDCRGLLFLVERPV